MLTVSIETDNAAFDDDAEGACTESARILRVIAGALEAGALSGKARDINGNTVGNWELNAE